MKTRRFRWKAIVPFGLVVLLLGAGWWLFADALVRRGVEAAGAAIVGAQVDVAEATVSLARGQVRLRGMQVTDPDAPLTNLVEFDEIVADVEVLPLFEKKVVIDTVAVRGVRFGTPRASSGALARPSATAGLVRQQVTRWKREVSFPALSLEGLGQAVRLPHLSADSLQTGIAAHALEHGADSMRGAWEAETRELNPQPQIDSARALAQRLRGASLRSLGLSGVRDAARSVRSTLAQLDRTRERLAALERGVATGVDTLRRRTAALDAARQADYAFARGLVRLPSLDSPDLSASLLGDWAMGRVAGLLYWVAMAERYLTPGLDPRRRTGPRRARRAGTTVEFPREREYPGFLLQFAEATGELGGGGAAAGRYAARLTGLTSSPALYGRPTVLTARRTAGRAGPEEVRVGVVLDHVRLPLRDSIGVVAQGVSLPTITLSALGAEVSPERGTAGIAFRRTGDSIAGRWSWRSSTVRWARTDTAALSPGAPVGSRAWRDVLVWRTVSGLREVDVEADVRGTLAHPKLEIRSNLGREIARGLRQAVGEEVARAERQVRAEVDRLIQAPAQAARAQADAATAATQAWVADQRRKLDQAKADLEARLRELTRIPGVRVP